MTVTNKTDNASDGGLHPMTCSPSDYDAGLLNDYGGGDVGWWQDYLRAEIGRANDYWRELHNAAMDTFRELSRRNYQDAGTQAIAWNKLRDERDEARTMARDQRNQLEKASPARLVFPWENDKGPATQPAPQMPEKQK